MVRPSNRLTCNISAHRNCRRRHKQDGCDRQGLAAQMIQNCDLSIASAKAGDVTHFALFIEGQLAGEDVIRRYDPLECGLHNLLRPCRHNIEREMRATEIIEHLRKKPYVVLQSDLLACLTQVLFAHLPEGRM